MIRSHTYLLLFISLLSGCSQIIEMDIPEHEPKLVLNGFIIADETDSITENIAMSSYANHFTVSKSVSALSKDFVEYYDDAEIEIYQNGNMVEVITEANDESGWGISYTYKPSIDFQPGNTYEIRASHSSKPDELSATQTLPAKPHVYNVQKRPQDGIISFTFDDPPGPNQYLIRVYTVDPFSMNTIYFNIIDGGYTHLSSYEEFDFEEGEQYERQGILVDDAFDGKSKTIEIRTFQFENTGLNFIVEFISMTKDMERYLRSYYLKMGTEGNPFAEPTQIYFNVKGNGYGSVTGGTRVFFKTD
jgi:hypothetical protein